MSAAQFPPAPWGVNDDGDVADEGGDIVAINPRLGSFPAHLIAAAPKLFAVIGDPEGYHDPLGFLSALVIDLKERLDGSKIFRTEWEGDDPASAWECLSEVEELIARGRAALSEARGDQTKEPPK